MAYKTITDDLFYTGVILFKNLIPKNGSSIPKLSTTPSVFNLSLLVLINTVPVSITNFIGGTQYQTIRIKGDGQTTINNNTKIKTNTGANKLLAVNRMYSLTQIDEVWYEQ